MIFLGPKETHVTWRGGQKTYKVATSRRRAPQGGAPEACGRPVDHLTLIPTLYILKYSPYTRGHTKNTFLPPQASVPVRSHLEAFFGTAPEGDSITEGLYTNFVALPMMCEKFIMDLRDHS